jgi:hypothetical protein
MKHTITYLPHKLINRNDWDNYVVNALNRRIYAMSFFLDIMSPGWDALIVDEGRALMPVTRNRKFGINYICQPLFVQQLGCFYQEESYQVTEHLLLDKLARSYRFIDMALNGGNTFVEPYRFRFMNNFVLRLDRPYDVLFAGFHANTRRNIVKSRHHRLEVSDGYPPAALIDMFIRNNGRNYPGIGSKHYSRLQTLLERGVNDDLFEISAARTPGGETVAVACFLKDFDRFVFYFSANTDKGREMGAMFFLIDSFIDQHSGTGKLLDMNGSMNPGLVRFYQGFGAENIIYRRLYINNLIFPLKYFKPA